MPSSACDWSSDVCSSDRSEEHTSELQSRSDLVCRLLLEKKKNTRELTVRLEEQRNKLKSGSALVSIFLIKTQNGAREAVLNCQADSSPHDAQYDGHSPEI